MVYRCASYNFRSLLCVFFLVVTVGFTESSYALSESDLQATVDIAVTQGVLQSGLSARVLVSTINGTAEGWIHYSCSEPSNPVVLFTSEKYGQ